MISFNTNGIVPYIAISVIYTDSNQQQAIETVVGNLVRRYLHQYGYPANIAFNWSEREDIHIPLLIIRYARNKQEAQALGWYLNAQRKSILEGYTPVTDDTENDDLFE